MCSLRHPLLSEHFLSPVFLVIYEITPATFPLLQQRTHNTSTFPMKRFIIGHNKVIGLCSRVHYEPLMAASEAVVVLMTISCSLGFRACRVINPAVWSVLILLWLYTTEAVTRERTVLTVRCFRGHCISHVALIKMWSIEKEPVQHYTGMFQ